MKDSPDLIKKVYDLDAGYSKLNQYIKSQATQRDLREAILPYYSFIRDVFLTLTLHTGNYPYLNS